MTENGIVPSQPLSPAEAGILLNNLVSEKWITKLQKMKIDIGMRSVEKSLNKGGDGNVGKSLNRFDVAQARYVMGYINSEELLSEKTVMAKWMGRIALILSFLFGFCGAITPLVTEMSGEPVSLALMIGISAILFGAMMYFAAHYTGNFIMGLFAGKLIKGMELYQGGNRRKE